MSFAIVNARPGFYKSPLSHIILGEVDQLSKEPDLSPKAVQAAIVRGIRCHIDFAQSAQVKELCAANSSSFPQLTRARNARLIMSDIVPDQGMDQVNEQPYCIWYPDCASQETYRELARRYPIMIYQAARACAVTGYHELYEELRMKYSLLPDVSIAEEARESNTPEGLIIYESIMQEPARFLVMDDYDRTITLEQRQPDFLNGDTTIRWRLSERVSLKDRRVGDVNGADIEEDSRVEEEEDILLTDDGTLWSRFDKLYPSEPRPLTWKKT